METRCLMFSLPFPTGPGAGPAFCTMDKVYRGVALITHVYLASRLRMSGAILLLPPCLLWRVVGLLAVRMLVSQEGCPLGLHYYYCWIDICSSPYTGGAGNILGGCMGFHILNMKSVFYFHVTQWAVTCLRSRDISIAECWYAGTWNL